MGIVSDTRTTYTCDNEACGKHVELFSESIHNWPPVGWVKSHPYSVETFVQPGEVRRSQTVDAILACSFDCWQACLVKDVAAVVEQLS